MDGPLLIFYGQVEQKAQTDFFYSETIKTKEHKENNRCQKYDLSKNAFYKINF